MPHIIDGFKELNEQQKLLIIQVGIECYIRAATVSMCGWHTLKGAMHYIDKDAPEIVDMLLCMLSGGDVAQRGHDRMTDFIFSKEYRDVFDVLHPMYRAMGDKLRPGAEIQPDDLTTEKGA